MDDAHDATRHPEPDRPGVHPAPHARPRAARASRGVVRVWAWSLGALSFLSPFALFGLFPKPTQSQGTGAAATADPQQHEQRRVIVIVTKKIVYSAAPASRTSSGPITYVQAPSAPAVATTCGTAPC